MTYNKIKHFYCDLEHRNTKKNSCKYKPLRYQSPGIGHTGGRVIPDGTTAPFRLDRPSPCIGQETSVF